MNGVNSGITFVDTSLYNRAVTRNGAVTSTTQSKFGGSAGYFDGSSYVKVADDPVWNIMGYSQFCMQMWVNFSALPSGTGSTSYVILASQYTVTADYPLWYFGYNNYSSANKLFFKCGDAGAAHTYTVEAAGLSWSTGTWYHLAVVKNGSVVYLYRDGSLVATGGTFSFSMPDVVGEVYLCTAYDGVFNYYLNGYMQDFVLVANSDCGISGSVYPVPTAPFPSYQQDLTALTKLWIPGYGANGSTDIKDRSAYGKTITNTNVTVSTTQSKFNGSSLYFDGTTATLAIPYSSDWVFSGDYFISMWYYPVSNPTVNRCTIMGFLSALTGAWPTIGWVITHETDGSMLFQASNDGGSGITLTTGVLSLNTWNHLTVLRSGTTTSFYTNGSRASTTTTAYTVKNLSTSPVTISTGYNDVRYDNCYIGDVTIINGSALGISGTTCPVPSKPFNLRGLPQRSYTPVQYDGVADGIDKFTRLVVHGDMDFTDSSFYNWTPSAAGGIAISNSYFKFGGASIISSGTTSILSYPNATVNTGTDFTISMWFRSTSSAGTNYYLFSKSEGDSSRRTELYYWGHTEPKKIGLYVHDGTAPDLDSYLNSAESFMDGNWHYAFLKKVGTLYIWGYDSRSTSGSFTGNANASTATFKIGGTEAGQTCYIDEVIITTSNSNLTVPTRPAQIPQRIATRDMQSSVSTVANPVLYIKGDSYTDSNTKIYDSSPYARTITNTNVVTRTINQKYGPSSMYFNGSSKLAIPYHSSFDVGRKNFVISCWINFPNMSFAQAARTIYMQAASDDDRGSNAIEFCVYSGSGLTLECTIGGSSLFQANEGANGFSANVWYHVVGVRSGNTASIYRNGIRLATATFTDTAIPAYESSTWIGQWKTVNDHNIDRFFLGYIDEMTVVIGSDLGYTGATIPVPQGPYKFT
jgi:hypothetical protein